MGIKMSGIAAAAEEAAFDEKENEDERGREDIIESITYRAGERMSSSFFEILF